MAELWTKTVLSSGEHSLYYPDNKVHWANMGPTWVLSAPVKRQTPHLSRCQQREVRDPVASPPSHSHLAQQLDNDGCGGIQWSLVGPHHKGQWPALVFSLMLVESKSRTNSLSCQWFEAPWCSLWRHCNVTWLNDGVYKLLIGADSAIFRCRYTTQ